MDEEERAVLIDGRQKEIEKGKQQTEAEVERRATAQEESQAHCEKVTQKIEDSRTAFKEKLNETMGMRNSYRDKISTRKEKETALLDILKMEKIDLASLQKAIEEAIENIVRQPVIKKGEKQLKWLNYCAGVVGEMQAALSEKNKEKLAGILEKIGKESITVEPKQFNDAKNAMNKMK